MPFIYLIWPILQARAEIMATFVAFLENFKTAPICSKIIWPLEDSDPDPKGEVRKSLLACDSDSSEDCDPDWLAMKSDCDSDSSVVEFGLINVLRSVLLGSKPAKNCDSDSSDCDSDSLSDCGSRIALLESDSQNLNMINGRFKTTSVHCFAN